MYLLYHDITGSSAEDSGFSGASAAFYKLDAKTFRAHVDIVRSVRSDLTMTFDDCGKSALSIADVLEENGLRGFFFAPTAFIGQRAFSSVSDLRELLRRGHRIGSHSHSHPIPISALPALKVFEEWQLSKGILEDWLGEEVKHASIPGGFLTSRVLDALQRAQFGTVFTSEPSRRISKWKSLDVVGRYSITRSSGISELRSVAAGDLSPWIKQQAVWNTKKILKRLGGETWLRLREWAFENRSRTRE